MMLLVLLLNLGHYLLSMKRSHSSLALRLRAEVRLAVAERRRLRLLPNFCADDTKIFTKTPLVT